MQIFTFDSISGLLNDFPTSEIKTGNKISWEIAKLLADPNPPILIWLLFKKIFLKLRIKIRK